MKRLKAKIRKAFLGLAAAGVLGVLVLMATAGHAARKTAPRSAAAPVTASMNVGEIFAIVIGGTAMLVIGLGVYISVLHKRTAMVLRPQALPAAPRRELPAPLRESNPAGIPDRPFTWQETIPVPAGEPRPALPQASKCKGPECGNDLPDDPWKVGAAAAVDPAGEEPREVEYHQFCSEACSLHWIASERQAITSGPQRR